MIQVNVDDNVDNSNNATNSTVEGNELVGEVVNGTLVVGNMTFVNGSLVEVDYEVDDLGDGPGLLSTSESAVGDGGSLDLTAANETSSTENPVQDLNNSTTNNQQSNNTLTVKDDEEEEMEEEDRDEDGSEVSSGGTHCARAKRIALSLITFVDVSFSPGDRIVSPLFNLYTFRIPLFFFQHMTLSTLHAFFSLNSFPTIVKYFN